ncbi:MAG TPA: LysM domain-containing protein [Burkholderiaceae bacterium]|nr:LysM domain-containing protein [Burkholderiaceae bacterium]
MNKTKTGILAITVLSLTATASSVLAQSATSRYPITPEQRSTADQVAQAGVPLAELAPNAPDRYTVKRGDTLWDLSSMYLTSPWRWPELWGMNKDQVKNPHLIYPGQELVLIKTDGRARLQVAGDGESPVGKLEPRIRDLDAQRLAIPSIPNSLIEPFLSQPLVLDRGSLDAAARIVATQEGRVFVGRGDDAYARGIASAAANYNVFRPLRPLYDPDDVARKNPIAYEAFYLGTANMVRPGEIAKVRIDNSKQEIGIGDRMLPVERQRIESYVPKRPGAPVDGRVISIYDGVRYGGGGQIITLNRGGNDGLTVGDVLQLWRVGETRLDRTAPTREFIKLPDEQTGLAFVFRVFPTISYALIQRGTSTVEVGDRASNPGDNLSVNVNVPRETEADRILRQPLRPLNPQ